MDKFTPIASVPLNNDGIGFAEYYPQFAYANLNEKSRIEAITNIASICYANPKAFGSESLYNRLAAESAGLPSSSFEFVPILLDERIESHRVLLKPTMSNIRKFGQMIQDKGVNYLLTNYRALIYDFEDTVTQYLDLTSLSEDKVKQLRDTYLNIYNTVEQCSIIEKHFHVFNFKVDLATRAQMVRHRISWQELSRRYVSGNKVSFDFYISPKMVNLEHEDCNLGTYSTEWIIQTCVDHYNYAIQSGVKPEEARRILPQAMYTQIWGAFQPRQLDNFFKLRLDAHAQKEIREVAQAMQSLLEGQPK